MFDVPREGVLMGRYLVRWRGGGCLNVGMDLTRVRNAFDIRRYILWVRGGCQ